MMVRIGGQSEWWQIQNEILIIGFWDEGRFVGKLGLELIQMDTGLSRLPHEDLRWFLFQLTDGLDEGLGK